MRVYHSKMQYVATLISIYKIMFFIKIYLTVFKQFTILEGIDKHAMNFF